jgi:hypothetical protein
MVAPGPSVTVSAVIVAAAPPLCGLPGAPGVEALGKVRVGKRQHGSGQQRGVDRAGLADGQRTDGHAGRHLDDGQQAVEAAESGGLHRHGEDRKRRQRRRHARQMRRPSGAGDDHLVAGALRAAGEGIQPLGRAVGRDDPRLMADLELVEGLGGMRITCQSDWLPMMTATGGASAWLARAFSWQVWRG